MTRTGERMGGYALSLAEYWDKLDKADWLFETADDKDQHEAGKQAMNQLRADSWQSAGHTGLFLDFVAYHLKAAPTKPPRPEEDA